MISKFSSKVNVLWWDIHISQLWSLFEPLVLEEGLDGKGTEEGNTEK